MIVRMAWKSTLAHPVRTAVLGIGFGLGVSVMATLLGVGEVVLDQARSPKLQGGGDLIVTSAGGAVTSARFVLSRALAVFQRGCVAAQEPPRGGEQVFQQFALPRVPDLGAGTANIRNRQQVQGGQAALGFDRFDESTDDFWI